MHIDIKMYMQTGLYVNSVVLQSMITTEHD